MPSAALLDALEMIAMSAPKSWLPPQVLVEQERQPEARPQHQLLAGPGRVAGGIGVQPPVGVVQAGQVPAVLAAGGEPPGMDARWGHQQVVRHGKEAKQPPPHAYPLAAAGGDLGVGPHRQTAPAVGGREEPPVTELVAQARVRDVVGRQAEPLDSQHRLAVGRTWLSFCNAPRLADGVAADLDRMHGRGPYPAAGKPAAGKRAAPGSGGI